MGTVVIKQSGDHQLVLEWESGSSNDMIADACLSLIMGIDSSPASVKCTYQKQPSNPSPI